MLQICIRSSCLCPSSAQSLRASSCHGGVSLTRTLVLPRRAFSASCAVQSGKTTILREHVYGRTRIYTSTMGKIKSSTTTKTCIAAPVTSPRLTWEWLHTAPGSSASPHEQRPSSPSLSIISSVKQNLRELFLPVGYPDNLHPCYKKFHLWLALETYVGSCIGVLCSQAMLASLGLGTVEATSG
ncbi:hypothetical protein BC940DRAFT_1941 [Gongronella butleri]|nr:hypothetical protein BC940DRAFT_1941 [Gongronella butleri]